MKKIPRRNITNAIDGNNRYPNKQAALLSALWFGSEQYVGYLREADEIYW